MTNLKDFKYEYIEHSLSLSITTVVKKLQIKLPEFVKIENEKKTNLKMNQPGSGAEIDSFKGMIWK